MIEEYITAYFTYKRKQYNRWLCLHGIQMQTEKQMRDNWRYLYKAPKYWLATNKTFLSFRENLDEDIKNEFITDGLIKELQCF